MKAHRKREKMHHQGMSGAKVVLKAGGMSCDACERSVTRRPSRVPGETRGRGVAEDTRAGGFHATAA